MTQNNFNEVGGAAPSLHAKSHEPHPSITGIRISRGVVTGTSEGQRVSRDRASGGQRVKAHQKVAYA